MSEPPRQPPQPPPPEDEEGRPTAGPGLRWVKTRLRLLGAVLIVLGVLGLLLAGVERLTGYDILQAYSEWVLIGAVAVALFLRHYLRWDRD